MFFTLQRIRGTNGMSAPLNSVPHQEQQSSEQTVLKIEERTMTMKPLPKPMPQIL